MTSAINASPSIEFYPPLVDPTPNGLFAAIDQGSAWEDTGADANRFSINGVRVRNFNYGSESSTGVWGSGWCGKPGPSGVKGYNAQRPAFPNPFDPITVWAWDACDLTARSRAEVERNAEHWLKVRAGVDVERTFADRLISEAGAPQTSTSFMNALAKLEAAIAKTGLPGFIHASPFMSPYANGAMAVRPSPIGSPQRTSMGTTWVFGGGYVDGLGMVMVATSQPYGWRDAPALTTASIDPTPSDDFASQYVAVAEQTFAVGYERLIAAVTVTIP